jgi:hypothetical protein
VNLEKFRYFDAAIIMTSHTEIMSCPCFLAAH